MPDDHLKLSQYGNILKKLIATEKVNDLGPGNADRALYAELYKIDMTAAIPPLKIQDDSFAAACRAALWLRTLIK